MKKILSLALAVLIALSMIPTALATNDYTAGTLVEYTATGSESYIITVPAQLVPGGSGTVTLSGTWADNRVINVTADPTVTLINSIKADDQKVLDITFAGISEAGSNTGTQTFTENVAVADIENALFGTWSGKFNYNVQISNVPTEPIGYLYGRVAQDDEIPTHTIDGVDYVGVVLPKLPEWDKTTYPYAVIFGTSSYAKFVIYSVKPTTSTLTDGGSIYYGTYKVGVCDNFKFESGEDSSWVDDPYAGSSYDPSDYRYGTWYRQSMSSILWANHDVSNSDGTLFLAASDPIPVYE